MIFTPYNTGAVILSHPEPKAHPAMTMWLMMIGIAPERIYVHGKGGRHIACGWNASRKAALAKPCLAHCEQFIMAENDIGPYPGAMKAFLAEDGPVVGCRYNNGSPDWQKAETFFGLGLWRCERRVLESLPTEGIFHQYNEDGTSEVGCLCFRWAAAIREAGFEITTAGMAGHDPKRSEVTHGN